MQSGSNLPLINQEKKSFKEAVLQKNTQALEKYIKENPDILNLGDDGYHPALPGYGYVMVHFRLAEFAILFSQSAEIVQLILNYRPKEYLDSFLIRKYPAKLNDAEVKDITGLHLVAVACDIESTQTIFQNANRTLITEGLAALDSIKCNPPRMALVSNKDCAVWPFYLNQTEDKQAMILQEDIHGCTSLDRLLMRESEPSLSSAVKQLLLILGDKAAQTVFNQHKSDHSTALHTALLENLNDDIIKELVNTINLHKKADIKNLSLIFTQKNLEFKTPSKIAMERCDHRAETPFEIAKRKKRTAIIQLFLEQIDANNTEHLEIIAPIFKNDETILQHSQNALLLSRINGNKLDAQLSYAKYESWCFRKMLTEIISDIDAHQGTLAMKISLREVRQSIFPVYNTIFALYKYKTYNKERASVFNTPATDPEKAYFLAVCYRYGKGVEVNPEQAAGFYAKAHELIVKELESATKSKNKDDLLIEYLHSFKKKIIQNLKNYFTQATDMNSKYQAAIRLAQIIDAKNEDDDNTCDQLITFFKTQHIANQTSVIAQLNFKLARNSTSNEYFQQCMEYKHGPALIQLADRTIKRGGTDNFYDCAAEFYAQAIITENTPVIPQALQGLQYCLENKSKDKMVLDAIAKTVIFIRDYAKTPQQKQHWALYKDFLNDLIEKYKYLPAKHAFALNSELFSTFEKWKSSIKETEYCGYSAMSLAIAKQKFLTSTNLNLYLQDLADVLFEDHAENLLFSELEDNKNAKEKAKSEINEIYPKITIKQNKTLALLLLALCEENPKESIPFKNAEKLYSNDLICEVLTLMSKRSKWPAPVLNKIQELLDQKLLDNVQIIKEPVKSLYPKLPTAPLATQSAYHDWHSFEKNQPKAESQAPSIELILQSLSQLEKKCNQNEANLKYTQSQLEHTIGEFEKQTHELQATQEACDKKETLWLRMWESSDYVKALRRVQIIRDHYPASDKNSEEKQAEIRFTTGI